MALDKIIVLVMALAFFGGLVMLALKGRRNRNSGDASPAFPPEKIPEGDTPPMAREKKRRNTRN